MPDLIMSCGSVMSNFKKKNKVKNVSAWTKIFSNTFERIINGYKGELKNLPNTGLLASEPDSESCQTSKMKRFAKSSKTKSRSLFLQKPRSWMFDELLNMFPN